MWGVVVVLGMLASVDGTHYLGHPSASVEHLEGSEQKELGRGAYGVVTRAARIERMPSELGPGPFAIKRDHSSSRLWNDYLEFKDKYGSSAESVLNEVWVHHWELHNRLPNPAFSLMWSAEERALANLKLRLSTMIDEYQSACREVVAQNALTGGGRRDDDLRNLKAHNIAVMRGFYADRDFNQIAPRPGACSEIVPETSHVTIRIFDAIDGPTLQSLDPYNNNEVDVLTGREMMCGTMRAMLFLTEHGVVHGDLKDDNEMVDRNRHKVYVIDFGRADFFDEGTLTKKALLDMRTVAMYLRPDTLSGHLFSKSLIHDRFSRDKLKPRPPGGKLPTRGSAPHATPGKPQFVNRLRSTVTDSRLEDHDTQRGTTKSPSLRRPTVRKRTDVVPRVLPQLRRLEQDLRRLEETVELSWDELCLAEAIERQYSKPMDHVDATVRDVLLTGYSFMQMFCTTKTTLEAFVKSELANCKSNNNAF